MAAYSKKMVLIPAPKGYPGPALYRGRVPEHYVAYWRLTGKLIPNGFDLIHKNGNHKDNSLENLSIVKLG